MKILRAAVQAHGFYNNLVASGIAPPRNLHFSEVDQVVVMSGWYDKGGEMESYLEVVFDGNQDEFYAYFRCEDEYISRGDVLELPGWVVEKLRRYGRSE